MDRVYIVLRANGDRHHTYPPDFVAAYLYEYDADTRAAKEGEDHFVKAVSLEPPIRSEEE